MWRKLIRMQGEGMNFFLSNWRQKSILQNNFLVFMEEGLAVETIQGYDHERVDELGAKYSNFYQKFFFCTPPPPPGDLLSSIVVLTTLTSCSILSSCLCCLFFRLFLICQLLCPDKRTGDIHLIRMTHSVTEDQNCIAQPY